MDDQQFDDLKQLIASVVSQSESWLRKDLPTKGEMNAGFDRLEKKIDDGFAGVGDALESIHAQLDAHEVRLTNLEQAA